MRDGDGSRTRSRSGRGASATSVVVANLRPDGLDAPPVVALGFRPRRLVAVGAEHQVVLVAFVPPLRPGRLGSLHERQPGGVGHVSSTVARRYVTTFEGFEAPWSHLATELPALRVRTLFLGAAYFAVGHAAEALPD